MAQGVTVKPVKQESRTCFGIEWYTTEEDAMMADARVRKEGRTYNGGLYHGMPCGRDRQWDHFDQKLGTHLFAVTN